MNSPRSLPPDASRPDTPPRPATLPPAGPAWAGALMGTSILATQSATHHIAVIPQVTATAAVGIAIFLLAGWLQHRNPAFHQKVMAPWGLVAMGILALGTALRATTGIWAFQTVSWWIATPLAVVVCINQLRAFAGAPTFQWGLALVAPMVSATSAAEFGYHTAGVLCFALAWCTAIPVFVRVYVEALRRRLTLPPPLAGTAWIPLGIVGQSTAAAQLLFNPTLATVYGFAMLTAGIGPVLFAMKHFYSAILNWAPYSPGWGGSTFSAGTVASGSYLLAETIGQQWLSVVSWVFLGLLAFHWCVCVARFFSHVVRIRRAQRV